MCAGCNKTSMEAMTSCCGMSRIFHIYLCISPLDTTRVKEILLSLFFLAQSACLTDEDIDQFLYMSFYHCVCAPSAPGFSAGAHLVPAASSPAPPQRLLCFPEPLLGLNPDIYEQPQRPSLFLPIQGGRSPEMCPGNIREIS